LCWAFFFACLRSVFCAQCYPILVTLSNGKITFLEIGYTSVSNLFLICFGSVWFYLHIESD
jgi:RNase P subunit RPR2